MTLSESAQVSVIMPVYNGAGYLAYAIESILSQTFKNFELLIINDGSTDNSEAIIRGCHDNRIRYLSQPNIGLTRTLNRLIEEAKHPLLARMDQDDWSHPDRLRQQVDFLLTRPLVKMCGSWIQTIDTKNNPVYKHKYPVTNHAIQEEMLLSNPFAHGSVMIRKEPDVFYRTEYNDAEDIDHWARHCMHHSVANIPATLYHWRVNPEGITHSRVEQQQAAAKKVRAYYQSWYLKNTSQELPAAEEMQRERHYSGRLTLFNRKRALIKIFRHANRSDLVKREWRYLRNVLLS